jgi:hypothetical protein
MQPLSRAAGVLGFAAALDADATFGLRSPLRAALQLSRSQGRATPASSDRHDQWGELFLHRIHVKDGRLGRGH